jgi:hypothetical protein
VGTVQVKLDTKTFRGPLGREIELTTNDPRRKKTFLRIVATIVSDVVVHPETLALVSSGAGARGQLLVRAYSSTAGPLQIGGVDGGSPWLAASARRVERAQRFDEKWTAAPGDWILDVELDASAPPGRHRFDLSFDTGMEREPRVEIPVNAQVASPITTNLERLTLEPAADGQPAQGEILVAVRRGSDVAPLTATISPDEFAAALEQTGPRHYRARITWTGPRDRRSARGELVLLLGEARLVVPVTLGE